MVTVEVRSRVEPGLKQEASAILKAAGLDVSTAILRIPRHGGHDSTLMADSVPA
jgi:hypothetical protein